MSGRWIGNAESGSCSEDEPSRQEVEVEVDCVWGPGEGVGVGRLMDRLTSQAGIRVVESGATISSNSCFSALVKSRE